MKQRGIPSPTLALAALCGMTALSALPAYSQTAPSAPSASQDDDLQEVIVTGTLIRGVAPVGTEVTTTTREDIVKAGVVSTQELLATMPAITNAFNTVPSVNTGVSGITTVRPSIHNIGASGGSTTLVLMDGHDMVGAGILATTPDAGILPPAVLSSVEVISDGGSAIYGADAVGGIVNFITRKHMEGVEADIHHGIADSYHATDYNLSAGHEWGSGSFMVSYAYRDNSNLAGADRSYARQNLTPFGGSDQRGNLCNPGNVVVAGASYALPGLVAGTKNLCDQDLYRDIFPEEAQHSAYAAFSQDLNDRISFDVTGYYASRNTTLLQPQISSSGVINNTNPFFISAAGATSETVQYNYAAARGGSFAARTNISEYGVTPELKIKFGGDWDLTALANFGRSTTTGHSPEINAIAESAARAGTTAATALNPFNTAATSPAVLSSILDYEQYAHNRQQLMEFRAVAQGSLFTMSGGAARLAAGGQFERQDMDAVQTDAAIGDLSHAAFDKVHQSTTSAFAELLLPFVSASNAFTAVRSLNADLSARFDHYNDFGNTTNPKIGLDWKPFDDVTLRASYGTSFVSPSLADETGSIDARLQFFGVSPFGPGGFVPRPTYLIAGGGDNLKPEKGKTFSYGLDFKPSWLPSTSLSLTYWDTRITDGIGIYPFYLGQTYFNSYPTQYLVNPTLAQADAFVTSVLGAGYRTQGPTLASLYAAGNPPYAILNAVRSNVSAERLKGVDFALENNQPTNFGSFSSGVSGTFALSRRNQVAPTVPFTSEFNNRISRLQASAHVGATVGEFTARATLQYSSGFPVVGIVNQTAVASFHPINLLFMYNFKPQGSLKGVTLSLNVNNLLDENPAFINRTTTTGGDGQGNGATLGRFFNLGLHAKF